MDVMGPFVFVFLLGLNWCAPETASASEDGGAIDLRDRHVVIGPPVNLTTLFVGSTNIVVVWDPPVVYVAHDISGDEVIVSKHKGSLVAVNVTAADTDSTSTEGVDSTSETPSGSLVPTQSRRVSVINDTPTPSSLNEEGTSSSSTPPSLVCRPLTYFSNYTVRLKGNVAVNDSSMVVSFISSPESRRRHKVQIRVEHDSIVPFNKGCITKFLVAWTEENGGSDKGNMEITPTRHIANITGLKSGVTYKVVVTAIYVSGDAKAVQTPIFVTVQKSDADIKCVCSWQGSQNTDSCQLNKGQFCQCKPAYEGMFCERCKPGYYRTAPYFPCHRCPCESHSAKVSTCRFVEGFLECDQCDVGYTGNICHKCDKGYYRYRRRCVPCSCHGNTPPGADMMCLPSTGLCVSCQHNTTGFHCERCLPGYQGDAINFKNCSLSKVSVTAANSSSSGVSPGIIGAVVVALLALLIILAFAIWYKRFRGRRVMRPFWTVEMKKDQDDVGFNSVHNDNADMDDIDDYDFYEQHRSGKYVRLNEDI